MSATLYATEADMNRLFSSQGVTSFADHNQDLGRDDNVITRCLTYGSQQVQRYCTRYEPSALSQSLWVTECATILACAYLCRHRGNPLQEPNGILQLEERVLEDLKQVLAGDLPIPDIELLAPSIPFMSNMRVDRYAGQRQLRTVWQPGVHTPTNLPQERSFTSYYGAW